MENDEEKSTIEFPPVNGNKKSVKRLKLISVHVDMNSKFQKKEEEPNLTRNPFRYVVPPGCKPFHVPVKRIEFFNKEQCESEYDPNPYSEKVNKSLMHIKYLKEIKDRQRCSDNKMNRSYYMHNRNSSIQFSKNEAKGEFCWENFVKELNPSIKQLLMPLTKTRNMPHYSKKYRGSFLQNIPPEKPKALSNSAVILESISHKTPLKIKSFLPNNKFKARLHFANKKRLAQEANELRRKYLLHHPVVQLLEKNLNKPEMGEFLLIDKERAKSFEGIHIDGKIREMLNKYGHHKNRGQTCSYQLY